MNLFLSLENWLVDRWQIFYPFWVSLHFCNNIMNIFFIENELLVLRWSFVLITSITHKLTSRTSSIFFQRNRKYLIFHNISDFFLFKLIFRFQLVFIITGAGFSNIFEHSLKIWKYRLHYQKSSEQEWIFSKVYNSRIIKINNIMKYQLWYTNVSNHLVRSDIPG